MALTGLSFFAFLTVGIFVFKLLKLSRYVKQAKETGLPYTIVPILETEVLGKMMTPILRKIYRNHLYEHGRWPRWCRFTILDWAWEEKRKVHDELGEVFLVVSPEGIICYSADADMSWDVLQRRNDFLKPMDKYKMLELYGPNVTTTEGKAYNFHVRMTAPPFNDNSGANDLVWSETAYQTHRLMEAWTKEGSTRDLTLDINGLTLAVIALTGYGKKVDFTSDSADRNVIPPGYKVSFLHAIHTVTSSIVKILLFPRWFMDTIGWSDITKSHSQLEKYMREMIQKESAEIEKDANYESSDAKGNLLTSLLRASASEGAALGKGRKQAFTENEVLGNLFLYLLAGYETTANAIVYGLITLALRQDLQDKVMEEVDQVYKEAEAEGRTELNYASDFEKLEYTYGFMYEIFRVYPGVIIITKMVHQPTSITVYPENEKPQQYVLPADCRVYLNVPAVQYTERYWPEAEEIKPERWMSENLNLPADGSDKKVVAADRTRQVKGTLMTFSGGSRACLGRKFAQAEYLSVFATLLRDYRVELSDGLDKKVVKRELDNLAAGSITLSPLNNVPLKLVKREGRT